MKAIENMSGRVVGQICMITSKLSKASYSHTIQTPSERDILDYLFGDLRRR
jgi:hypothetical protein